MTLTEYINQKEPIRKPKVILQDGEYKFGVTHTKGLDKVTQVFIKGFPYEYSVTNKRGCLYTTDSDGNQKKLSVFWLDGQK